MTLVLLFYSFELMAQNISYPLYIGNANPIKDEFGRNLVGAATMQIALCDRVEVFSTTNGIIYPPDVHGLPDPRNVVITNGITSIGNHTSMGLTNAGLFSLKLTDNKPLPGMKLFVRVFNAPTREAASFYGDSEVFSIGFDSVYQISITNMTALNPFDQDGDGLSDSWEKSLGTDLARLDSDGDGIDDGQEMRAGTDAMDADSKFVMAWVRVGAGRDAVIAWESVPDKRYQVSCSHNDLMSDPDFVNVSAVITATAPITEITVPDGLLNEEGHYRVRLVED
ncbi:MAG TPA: hypothetical protein DCZ95_06315 [Verrucomicrobia bacterium]|nr:MAG: hypothetical protein A2X46_08270 [Lentisphaerae bacterium GWF2_57_35]HBA83692.1 hypothetical protein [Verrucomicrobiota bacterium]